MKKTVFIMLLLGLTLALPAGFHKHESSGLQIWFPDDWTVDNDDGVLTAESPDGDVSCGLEVVAGADSLDAALETYAEIVKDYFDGFEASDEPQKGSLNNLSTYIIQGKADSDGTPWDVDVALVANGQAIAILIVGNECAVSRKYETTFQRIMNNLKKI
jgi:hypothetical protein